MKLGDFVGNYRIITKPSTAGGGKSISAMGEREGRQFFVKRHLRPVFPLRDIEMYEDDRLTKKAICDRFVTDHLTVGDRIKRVEVGAGNVVSEEDFFLHGAHYYSVTPWIDSAEWEEIHSLEVKHLEIFIRTLVLSLRHLHLADVVHGDLKPQNIMIARSPRVSSMLIAKVIDLDDSYLSCAPPSARMIGGDENYMAPELLAYFRGDVSDGSLLTTKADMYSLGLILHEVLAGEPPRFDPDRFTSSGAATLAGEAISLSPSIPEPFDTVLPRMLDRSPGYRPSIHDLVDLLVPDLEGSHHEVEPTTSRCEAELIDLRSVEPEQHSRIKSTIGRRPD